MKQMRMRRQEEIKELKYLQLHIHEESFDLRHDVSMTESSL